MVESNNNQFYIQYHTPRPRRIQTPKSNVIAKSIANARKRNSIPVRTQRIKSTPRRVTKQTPVNYKKIVKEAINKYNEAIATKALLNLNPKPDAKANSMTGADKKKKSRVEMTEAKKKVEKAKKKAEKAKKNAEEALKKGLKNASERGDKNNFDQLWNSIPLPQREGYKKFVEPLLRKMSNKPLVVKMKKKVPNNRITKNNFEMLATITQMRKLNNEMERKRAFLEKRAEIYKQALKKALDEKKFVRFTQLVKIIPDSVKDKVMSSIKPFLYKAKKEQDARQRLRAAEANRSIKQNNIDSLASFAKTMQEGELLMDVGKKAKNEKNMMNILKNVRKPSKKRPNRPKSVNKK